MDALVDPQIAALLAQERNVLIRLKALLESTNTSGDTISHLADVIDQLDELFLVVVVGEFNAGKSSVLNALFGERLLEEGPIPTTAKIAVLRYGDEPMERQRSEFLVERRLPSDLLRHLNLVDTPGTNSIVRQHQRITEDFIPRADLVLFVTSFDRPLAESERQFLEYIRGAWGKRLVFVLNKADLAKSEEQLNQVLEHIRSGCRELMGFEPKIFPVSAELALAAKTTDRDAVRASLWPQSRFEALETFITDTLTGRERMVLKLNAPLDAAGKLLDSLDARLAARRRILGQDEQNLADLQARLEASRKALQEGYERHLIEIDNLLLELEKRGVQFLSDAIRVSKIGLLRDKDRFKEEFQRQVIRDTDRQIEDQVTEAVDRLFEQALALWQQTLREFDERLRAMSGPTSVEGQEFLYNRSAVFNTVMRDAERKIQTHDLREEARRILENAAEAADMVQYAGIGAGVLGVLSGVLVVATALDAVGGFGAATAVVLGAAGLAVLPRQRRKAISELKSRIDTLRADLRRALTRQLSQQAETTLGRLHETIAPYEQFVQEERTALADASGERDAVREEIERLRGSVRKTLGKVDLGA